MEAHLVIVHVYALLIYEECWVWLSIHVYTLVYVGVLVINRLVSVIEPMFGTRPGNVTNNNAANMHPQSWVEPHIHVHTGKSLPFALPSPEEHK